jgi:FAD/FMN-containing dehydrogenase
MALDRNVYKALEDIVGTDNISEEPAVLDAYALHWGLKAFTGNPFGLRHEAVLLPGSTEDVQAVVKTCNQYKIKYKALSTGWGSMNGAGSEGVIQLDLRRMNKILEINEKAMYAVVEPYVISAQLQAELMKRGLTCNIISAGSNTSALPLTALMGSGPTSVSTSYNNRNILGVEWVLPDGEILRTGSLGSGAGWFCGDGPGPSLRGIMRGYKAPLGGLGVFTGAATKVYHWPGPEIVPVEGASPGYTPELPETITAHYITFPSWEKLTEAGYKIGESEIALACDKLPPWMLALNLTENGREGIRLFSEIRSQTVDKGVSILVIIGADSQPEFDYKEKVLRRITAEADGEYLPLVEEPVTRKKLIWHRVRATTGARETFRLMLSQGASFGACDSWEFAVNEAEEGARIKKKYIEKGLIVDDGADLAWGTVYEHGHMGHMDELYLSDPTDPASGQAAFALMQETTQACMEKALGCPQTVMGDRGHDLFGPRMNNYHLWARKLKKAFDPNGTSESTNYITAIE